MHLQSSIVNTRKRRYPYWVRLYTPARVCFLFAILYVCACVCTIIGTKIISFNCIFAAVNSTISKCHNDSREERRCVRIHRLVSVSAPNTVLRSRCGTVHTSDSPPTPNHASTSVVAELYARWQCDRYPAKRVRPATPQVAMVTTGYCRFDRDRCPFEPGAVIRHPLTVATPPAVNLSCAGPCTSRRFRLYARSFSRDHRTLVRSKR